MLLLAVAMIFATVNTLSPPVPTCPPGKIPEHLRNCDCPHGSRQVKNECLCYAGDEIPRGSAYGACPMF